MKHRILRCLLAALAISGLLTGCGSPASSAGNTTSASFAQEAESTLHIYCFQAGKADAFLFWNQAGAVLIDTGESGFGKEILTKLEELGITRLDYLILTHFDKDHVGGAKKLLESLEIDTVLQSNCPKEGAKAYENYLAALAETGIEPITLRQTMTFTLGEAVFTVNPPALEQYAEDESNNSSLIVTLEQGSCRLLFAGDAEELRLTEFLESDPGHYDLVKLPHHGQYQPSLEALIRLTAPDYAVITSSEEEAEDTETLDLLSSYGVRILLTRTNPWQIDCDGCSLTVSEAPVDLP